MSISAMSASSQSPLTQGVGGFSGDAFASFAAFFAAMRLQLGGGGELSPRAQGADGVLSDKQLAALKEDGLTDLLAKAEGGEVLIEELSLEIKAVYEELTLYGINGSNFSDGLDTQELARAYQYLGMSPEEAYEKAQRVISALELVDKQVEAGRTSAEDEAALLAILLAPNKADDGVVTISKTTVEYHVRVEQTRIAFAGSSRVDSDAIIQAILRGETSLSSLGENGVNSLVSKSGVSSSLPNDTAASETARPAVDPRVEGARKPSADPAGALLLNDDTLVDADGVDDALIQRALDAAARSKRDVQELHAAARHVRADAPRELADANTVRERTAAQAAVGSVMAKAAEKSAARFDDDTAQATPLVARSAQFSALASGQEPSFNAGTARVVFSWQPTSAGQQFLTSSSSGEAVLVDDLTGSNQQTDDAAEAFFQRVYDQHQVTRQEQANPLAQLARQSHVSGQVQVQMRTLAKQGGGDVRMVLNPPELGEVEIEMKVHDGKVSGVVTAQSLEVLDQLARDLRILQQGFADAGLQLDKDGMQFQLKEQHEQGGNQGEGSDDDDGTFFAGQHEGEGPLWRRPDALVDVSV